MKTVLVLGADGYLGWPVSLFLAKRKYKVIAIDNFCKRNISKELKINPLFKTRKFSSKIKEWNKSNEKIESDVYDICNLKKLKKTILKFKPDSIIHFAEQPSAPYSMMGYKEARFTLSNNLLTTLNIIYASKEAGLSPHIIKLGTMGEYGTPNIDIEEGFINIKHKEREDNFLFPRKGGSLYHTTKIQDTDLLYFYVRAWNLKVTDLMQGPVYGLFTPETENNTGLLTSFYYDSIFGTVLNRFITQAICGFPLTVYGKGNQKRGYLNINDTLKCIEIAIKNPPKQGKLEIFNQFTEVFSVNDLADRVINASKRMGVNLKKINIENPRIEMEDHYYNPSADKFLKLGLKPQKLSIEFIENLITYLSQYKNNIRKNLIKPKIKWE